MWSHHAPYRYNSLENPIGIETIAPTGSIATLSETLQLIRKPDRDWNIIINEYGDFVNDTVTTH